MWVFFKKHFAAWAIGAICLSFGAIGQTEVLEYDGLIEPYEIVDIGAPTEGIVAKVMVDRSSMITKGQTLVRLDSSLERATLEKARAVAAFDSEISMQQSRLAFNRRVYQRIKPIASVSTHDKDQAAAEIERTEHLLKKAHEKKTMAKLELKKAQALLNRCSVKSPLSGVVVERFVSPGEYVNSQPLLRVAQIDPLRVEVIVPADLFGRIGPGTTAQVIPELPQYGTYPATVRLVDKVIDSASNTFGVRLDLPNTRKQLPAGLKCRVKFEIEKDTG